MILQTYQQVSMTDGIASGKVKGGGAASDMAGMMMGMNVANEMMKNINQNQNTPTPANNTAPAQAPALRVIKSQISVLIVGRKQATEISARIVVRNWSDRHIFVNVNIVLKYITRICWNSLYIDRGGMRWSVKEV